MDKRHTKERQSSQEKHKVKRSVEPKQEGPISRYEEPDLLAPQRAAANPALASPAGVLALQRSYGNHAVQRWLSRRQPEGKEDTSIQSRNQRQGNDDRREPATGQPAAVIQRALAGQVGEIDDWPTAGPFCTPAVWWWAAKEAAGGHLDPAAVLVGRIPTQFSALKALSDKKPKKLKWLFGGFGGGPKKTNLRANLPVPGTVLLWDSDMVHLGNEHAAVVKGGEICGYNQAGILEEGGAGATYTHKPAADLLEEAGEAYTIPEAKIVAEARRVILQEEEA